MTTCLLALEDGCVFAGRAFGAGGTRTGEVVFNTAMTGYQEVLTDPSYTGQIVTMTSAHIGNYGINDEDVESGRLHLCGFVVNEASRVHSNPRAAGSLGDYLAAGGIVALAGIDTRALTRRLRMQGAMRGAISTEIGDPRELVEQARRAAPMVGQDLVSGLPRERSASALTARTAGRRVVVIDCGVKRNILRLLEAEGCEVVLAPPDETADAILERRPAGVLAGNGPGDPAAVAATIETLRHLLGQVPIFGICLGCQLLALALGARTYKMKCGHHGANHPVLNLDNGRVEITSHNHGFAVEEASLTKTGARVTRVSLYDRTVEGFAHDPLGLLAVQYHPEAAPGPHDSRELFREFVRRLK
jgi:carbamoyl-phosphate synthase small subunit